MRTTGRLLNETAVRTAFAPELGRIRNAVIRELAVAFLRRAHPRFLTGPSSSTGIYHPPDEFFSAREGDPTNAPASPGETGGMVHHCRRVAYIVALLADAWDFTQVEHDLAMAGALVHDIASYQDNEVHIDRFHDSLVRMRTDDLADLPLFGRYYEPLVAICEAHMGRHGMGEPTVPIELAVATADYLASRPGFGAFDPRPRDPDFVSTHDRKVSA